MSEEITKISESINQKFHKEFTKLKTELENHFKEEIKSMKVEITTLKNQIKNVSEENIVLKEEVRNLKESEINGKPSKKHNDNDFKDIIESFEIIKKAHHEFSETTNKDFISIENSINSIEKVLSQHTKKINEQIESAEKTEKSIIELRAIYESTLDNGNPWIPVGKKGKSQKEVLEKNKEEKFHLLILGDSITKNINPCTIAKCNESEALNYSVGGSRVKGIYDQIRKFQNEHERATVDKIILHIGTNHLPYEQPMNVAQKICRLLTYLKEQFPNSRILYSAILPKFNKTFNYSINLVNSVVFDFCSKHSNMGFIHHSIFAINHELNKKLYWKDNLHTSNLGLRQLAKDLISYIRVNNQF